MKRERVLREIERSHRYHTATYSATCADVRLLVSPASATTRDEAWGLTREWAIRGADVRQAIGRDAVVVDVLLKSFCRDDDIDCAVAIAQWVRGLRRRGATVTFLRNAGLTRRQLRGLWRGRRRGSVR